MAFQAALCLVFVSPTNLEVIRDDLFKLVQNNIQNSNFQNKDKLPKLHVKLCEMSLHVFKSVISKITGDAFEYCRQSSRDIAGTLHNEDVIKQFYSYKVADAIKVVSCLQHPNNVDVDILKHIHDVAYIILRKYKGKDCVIKEINTYEEIKLFAGGVNEFVDSYDLIYSKSLELSNLTSEKVTKDFSEIKSHTTKKARLDDIFTYLVSVASPKEKDEKSRDVLECSEQFRNYLWNVCRSNGSAAVSNNSSNVNNDIADDTTNSSNSNTPNWKKLLGTIGKKRQTYSCNQINLFMRGMKAFLEENKESNVNPTMEDIKDCASVVSHFLKKIPGYECITHKRLIKWYNIYSSRVNVKNKWINRRKSPVVNYEFESSVWSKLIWVELINQIKPDGSTMPTKNIRGNITVSYSIIRKAGEETQKEPAFRFDRRVQSLKFSNKWIRSFLNRNKFTKKKINSKHKANFPSDKDINAHLEEARRNLFNLPKSNQSFIRDGPMKPSPDQIVNYDETAWHMTIDLQYLYSPTGVGRTLAPQGGNDARERITCIPTLLANGKLGPCMMIIKDSSSMGVADQSSMTVLDKCLKHLGARGSEWDSGVYSVTLTKPKCRKRKRDNSDNNEAGNNVTPRNNNVPSSDDNEEKLDYKINYLRHKENGHIICSQSKAYNDSLRQCLFIDLILRNIQRKSPGNLLFVWADNLGTHKTDEINAKYISSIHNQYSYIREPSHDTDPPRAAERNLLPDIRVGYLPPNTTAYLQPCDLLLNYLIKAFGRQLRNDLLYNDFQEWCKKMDELRKSGEYDPKQNYFFETTKVDYKQRLFELIDFYDNNLISQLSQDTVENCFIDCGLAPITKDPHADPLYWEKNYSESYGGASYKLIDISSKHKNVDVPIMPIKVDYEDYDESSITTTDQVDQFLREQDDEDRDDTAAVDLGDELSDIGDTFEPYSDDETQYTDGSDDEDNT